MFKDSSYPNLETYLSKQDLTENNKKYKNFGNRLHLYNKKLTNSDYAIIDAKLKKYYEKYYVNDLKKNSKSIHNRALQIQQKYKYNRDISHKRERNIAPRNVQRFKQDIYMTELNEVIEYLRDNLEQFPDFLSIVLFVAKKEE